MKLIGTVGKEKGKKHAEKHNCADADQREECRMLQGHLKIGIHEDFSKVIQGHKGGVKRRTDKGIKAGHAQRQEIKQRESCKAWRHQHPCRSMTHCVPSFFNNPYRSQKDVKCTMLPIVIHLS